MKTVTYLLMLLVVLACFLVASHLEVSDQPADVNCSIDYAPMTAEYMICNGKLAPELQTPLENYEAKRISK